MCSASTLAAVADAPTGVLGFTAKNHSPRAVAVTPYVVDGKPTVTTMLALLTKAKMLRNRPAAALLAGGTHVAAETKLAMHSGPDWFDTNIRQRELEKYPPARTLLSIPFHRRILWWYVGRVAISFDEPACHHVGGMDRVTITSVVDRSVQITPLPADLDVDANQIEVGPTVPDGPGCLLIHDETEGMAELLQLRLDGTVTGGVLTVESRRGSLEPQQPGALAQLAGLWSLRTAANANRSTIQEWDR